MRAAFLADLATRIAEIEALTEGLGAQRYDEGNVTRAVLAHLHDIKGCATPYGFPEATQLARSYEAELQKPALSRSGLMELLVAAAGDFRRLATHGTRSASAEAGC